MGWGGLGEARPEVGFRLGSGREGLAEASEREMPEAGKCSDTSRRLPPAA